MASVTCVPLLSTPTSLSSSSSSFSFSTSTPLDQCNKRNFRRLAVVAMADSNPTTVLVTGAAGRTGTTNVYFFFLYYVYSSFFLCVCVYICASDCGVKDTLVLYENYLFALTSNVQKLD